MEKTSKQFVINTEENESEYYMTRSKLVAIPTDFGCYVVTLHSFHEKKTDVTRTFVRLTTIGVTGHSESKEMDIKEVMIVLAAYEEWMAEQ
jgi:hypothetical protein